MRPIDADAVCERCRKSGAICTGSGCEIPTMPTLTPPNEPLTCGLVDRHSMPLRAGDTVAADKFFVYAVRYGSHNVNPDNCDGTAARYPAHCADTADGLYNLKLEVCCRPPEGEEDT